ncbi:RES family NAD+ phosphorylase [Streptomyces sp. GLT-R25]
MPDPSERAKPHRYVLPAGTELWRVHSTRRTATEFKAVPADLHWGGGRFCDIKDELSTDRRPYLYAGMSPLTAVCETLARSLRPRQGGWRRITQPRVRDQVLSKVVAAIDLPLVDLTETTPIWRRSARTSGSSSPRPRPIRAPAAGVPGSAARPPGRRACAGPRARTPG